MSQSWEFKADNFSEPFKEIRFGDGFEYIFLGEIELPIGYDRIRVSGKFKKIAAAQLKYLESVTISHILIEYLSRFRGRKMPEYAKEYAQHLTPGWLLWARDFVKFLAELPVGTVIQGLN